MEKLQNLVSDSRSVVENVALRCGLFGGNLPIELSPAEREEQLGAIPGHDVLNAAVLQLESLFEQAYLLGVSATQDEMGCEDPGTPNDEFSTGDRV